MNRRAWLADATRHATAPAKSGPPHEPAPKPEEAHGRSWLPWFWFAFVGLALVLLLLPTAAQQSGSTLTYSDFTDRVNAGQVTAVTIADNGAVTGVLRDGKTFRTQIPTVLNQQALTSSLQAHAVTVTGSSSATSWGATLVGLLLFGLLLGFLLWIGRLAQRGGSGGFGGFSRSRFKAVQPEESTTRFADVAGYDGVKLEVTEVVDFLRNPERYAVAGAKGPRGLMMVGPPGTGKTLIARAVAGEAGVPFLSVTGSAFVEMFVGVGASRVRDLFAEARKRGPAIIFIDEVDAIGGRRGMGAMHNDEREQTLNQLLAEMDGFDQRTGIVVIAATNRPESLDPALLRPGRFDRQVVVPLPTQAERAAILAVHAQGKHLDPRADLSTVARATPGFSGADLANLINEAAINAVRDGRAVIVAGDLDAARDRVLLGRRETSNALLPDERHAVAVHESGHALVAAVCPHADPVAKVTILPAGLTLGVTEQLPEAERHLYGESYLHDLLAVRMGGRAAELLLLGEASTGAANDLAGATQVATRMVREFGLSSTLGPVGYSTGSTPYLGPSPAEDALVRLYSEATQRVVDEEVASLLRDAEQRAVAILRAHYAALNRLVGLLEERETVDGDVVQGVLADERALEAPAMT